MSSSEAGEMKMFFVRVCPLLSACPVAAKHGTGVANFGFLVLVYIRHPAFRICFFATPVKWLSDLTGQADDGRLTTDGF